MTEPIRRPPPARRPRRLAKLLLASCTLLFCAVVGEGVLRITGGYRLFAPRLEPVRSASDPETVLAMAHDVVEPFTAHWRAARPDLDIAWLETSPPPPPAPPRLELPLLPQRDWLLNYYVVNEVLLRSPLAKKLMQAPNLTLPDEFTVFEPPGRKTAPHYRYPASRTLPTGLMTNQFGFRGREIDCDKPDRTVRIAFVGAVDVHRQIAGAVELKYADAVLLEQGGAGLGTGHRALNVVLALGQQRYELIHGGAGADTDHGAVFDVAHCRLRRAALLFVLGHGIARKS